MKASFVELEEEFAVPELSSGRFVACGIAQTETDKFARLKVATERYLREGYITADQLVDGVFLDKYELFAIPLVAKIGNRVVASLRLIRNNTEMGLPIYREQEVSLYPEWREIVKNTNLELSQLAKLPEYNKDPRPTLGLFRAYILLSRQMGYTDAAAVVDRNVGKMLNGPHMGFGLPIIGFTTEYLGSLSTPIYINTDNVISHSRQASHFDLADFLDGKHPRKFDWYMGV